MLGTMHLATIAWEHRTWDSDDIAFWQHPKIQSWRLLLSLYPFATMRVTMASGNGGCVMGYERGARHTFKARARLYMKVLIHQGGVVRERPLSSMEAGLLDLFSHLN